MSVGFGELPIYPNASQLKASQWGKKRKMMPLRTKNLALQELLILLKGASKNTRPLKISLFFSKAESVCQ